MAAWGNQLILVFPVGHCFWVSLLLDVAGMTVQTYLLPSFER